MKTDGGTIVSITTGSDGTGTSRLIPPGIYYVKEYQAPKGHSLNETIMEVVVTAGTSTATPIGVTIANKPTISYLNLKKSSSNPTLTNNNSCYSLAGAVYQVYKDVACKVPVEGAVLTTNEEGISNTVDLDPQLLLGQGDHCTGWLQAGFEPDQGGRYCRKDDYRTGAADRYR